ncbi:MAG TPA: hypothetical protein PK191_00530 [Niabella sp.]|nr:hypothetical protein [Niabella sp.]HOZ96587.1 hypothetical protein [Niabella sp.]HQW13232.1 hypothetical protein [Niabella sp.]HQX18728.1 hypothetical protein [Niabella sp.]HQX41614.1 hypothetical protein [Niabella sp.]
MKLSELKVGDWVVLNDEGVEREGTVTSISSEDHKVQVNNGIQEFWYTVDLINPMPLSETQLMRLGFEKMDAEGKAKYGKGAFRVATPSAEDFSKSEVWYREDKRFFDFPISVSHLQNIHLEMTKIQLEA